MTWKIDGMIWIATLIAFILGFSLCYSFQNMQIEHEHEWDVKCFIPPTQSYNNTTNIPITCYAPFFQSKTTINLTLAEKE